jgi:hypothetical protein
MKELFPDITAISREKLKVHIKGNMVAQLVKALCLTETRYSQNPNITAISMEKSKLHTRGHMVASLIKALCYKLEGCRFNSRQGQLIF